MNFKEERFVTITELAKILQVPVSWIYQRTRLGQTAIPHIKFGKYVRFEPKQVIEFFRGNHAKPTS